MPQSDPYAEFGGQMIQATPVANDPYAEFGGQTISAQPSESAFVTNRPQLPTPAEVIAPIAQSMQPFGASGPAAGKLTGLPGVNPHSPTGAEVAGDVALASSHEIAGPASRVVGQTVKGAVKAAPYLALSEGINYARKNLPMNMGKYIPPGAEWVQPQAKPQKPQRQQRQRKRQQQRQQQKRKGQLPQNRKALRLNSATGRRRRAPHIRAVVLLRCNCSTLPPLAKRDMLPTKNSLLSNFETAMCTRFAGCLRRLLMGLWRVS